MDAAEELADTPKVGTAAACRTCDGRQPGVTLYRRRNPTRSTDEVPVRRQATDS